MPRAPIAAKVAADMQSASFIRAMFETGRRLKAQFGEDNVYDFSLGNPNASPPPAFFAALAATAAERRPELHRYMPNAGFDEARAAVASFLSQEYRVAFDGASVVLTSGAAGAANIALRALLDPGDEVVVLEPYFPEYRFYIEQAGGKMVVANTTAECQPDLDALAAALSPRTRAVLLCSPNNPTGAVYPQAALDGIGELLARRARDDQPIYLLCDDVYRRILYDLPWCPTPVGRYPRAIVLSSYSKDVSIPGERLGYVAVPPALPGREQFLGALTMLNRTLGFVNASAFMQRVIARCADAMCDLSFYRANRDILCGALRKFGYELALPGGALYAFPRTPIADDARFVSLLQEQRILAVPGRGFGRPGFMRLSYCVDRKTVEGSLPGFEAAIRAARG